MESENTDVNIASNSNPEESADLQVAADTATGEPFPELTAPLFDEEEDFDEEDDFHVLTHLDAAIPYIIKAFSLSCDDLSQHVGQTSDYNKKAKDLFAPDKVEIKESCAEANVDNSFLEFVTTKEVSLDVAAKQNIVDVILKQYLDKLHQPEERLPKLGQLVSEEEMALALLKKEVDAKERSLEELRQNKELLGEEKKKLKRKVAHCCVTQQLLEGSSKKGRSE